MDILNPYNLIIFASIILVISFFFNELSRKTSVPAVLLLIVLGIVLNACSDYLHVNEINLMPVLEVLGIIGLIMIVLEAALELKLEKDKLAPIGKALLIAFIGLMVTAWIAAFVLKYFIPEMSDLQAWLYATPLSILSSSIIIPSVRELRRDKKEFLIYESTFSDILGIMLFYFLIAQTGSGDEQHGGGLLSFGLSSLLTVLLSLFCSYIIVLIFQNIRSSVKLFLLIAVLLLLYSIGKNMHLSSLIIILIFGLVISNKKLFFRGPLSHFLIYEKANEIYNGLQVVTMETSFVVRTFFFLVFGLTITFSSLGDWSTIEISALLLVIILAIRYIMFRIAIGKDIIPQVYVAPRGLISILLFYAIPQENQVLAFNQGILLYVIFGTAIAMTAAMIFDKNRSMRLINKAKTQSVSSVKWRLPEIDDK